jgi:hypothetical protein
VNTKLDCDHVRMRLMASIDGEADPETAADRQHASTCQACRNWLTTFESLRGQLGDLPYESAGVDLWAPVEERIRTSDERTSLVHQLWPIGAAVLAWRALQLFVDLPMPALHPLVPLVAAAAVLRRVGGDLLTIDTFAPELRKRGI